MELAQVLKKEKLNKEELIFLLGLTEEKDLIALYDAAYQMKLKYISNKAYYRGLIEFSNRCIKDCLYCGIRSGNAEVERFDMTVDEIAEMAQWAYENDYGSVTLQSGERTDESFVEFAEKAIKKIKAIGDGALGLTLCLGEQSSETYRRWYDAGGHRYLLRIETTHPELYKKIHPDTDLHRLENRISCLKELKRLGFQVGTGVMIGLPGQTLDNLAEDILFFEQMDIDMIGMGPYVVHKETPLGIQVIAEDGDSDSAKKERFLLGLKMIAVTRLYLKDVNIAATTALQALNSLGREMGLKAGANILMPIITALEHRAKYQLYDDKPCIDDTPDHCKTCLTSRVRSVGDEVGFAEWGDSPHFQSKQS